MTDRRVPTPPSTYTQPSLTTATESLRDLDAYVAEHDGEGGGGGTAATTTFTPAAGIAATDVQAAIEEAVTDAAATYATKLLASTERTADYTLALADASTVVEMNAATSLLVTIPTNASVAFPVGTVIELYAKGAGSFTVTGATGVTVRSEGGKFTSGGQYASATLWQQAADVWVLAGNLTAVLPSSITGMIYWFKGNGTYWQDSARTTPATLDGDPVGAWDDASTNASHAIQATNNSYRPVLKIGANGINSVPVLRFDGTDDNLVSPASSKTKPFTIFAVAKPTSFATYHVVAGAPAGGMDLTFTTGAKTELIKASTGILGTGTATHTAATAVLLTLTYDSSGNYAFYKNGAADGTGTNNVTFTGTGTTFIGQDAGGSYMLGDVAEVIKYDSVLSSADIRTVKMYLGSKYGLTIV